MYYGLHDEWHGNSRQAASCKRLPKARPDIQDGPGGHADDCDEPRQRESHAWLLAYRVGIGPLDGSNFVSETGTALPTPPWLPLDDGLGFEGSILGETTTRCRGTSIRSASKSSSVASERLRREFFMVSPELRGGDRSG